LIGSNPRTEAPVLNARIRKAWLNGATVGLIGEAVDLSYPYDHLGTGRDTLARLVGEGRDADVKDAPSIAIVGQGALTGADGAAVLAAVQAFCAASGSKLLVLHTAASRVGAMDLGCVTEGGLGAALDGAEVVYNLGADEIDVPAGPFVIYQGSHGDRGAHRADVILPGAAWVEEPGIFVNTEGRPQAANRAGFPPGEARENWAILRALSAALGQTLPFDSLAELRAAMFKAVPHLAAIDVVPVNEVVPLDAGRLGSGDFRSGVAQHYLANPIMRASSVMAELTRLADARTRPMAAE